jgi:lipopolysaccharide/colanic/teichoic acid biosynthesis glycosyltransferase
VLRRTSLDELPQLWNVLRGDMSVIGPRPTLRYQVDRYTDRQRRRLEVRPGLTGWAQVQGRARLSWAEKIELDVWYVDHRSPLVDLEILLRTPLALFRGTYKGESGGWRPER